MSYASVPDWPTFIRDFGTRLGRRRLELGITQEKVAHVAGMTRYHYQQLEKGQSRPNTPANPSFRSVLALAQALDMELVDLIPPVEPNLMQSAPATGRQES